MPKSRARAGGRPACAVGGDHPVGPTMGTIWRAARGGDLCPIRTSAARLPGPARSHQFAPSPRRGTAFSRVTSPQGRARSPGADRATGAHITRRTARSIETTLNDATVRAAASHHQRSATNLMSW